MEFVNFLPLRIHDAQGGNNETREAGAISYLRFTPFPIDSRNFAQGARFSNAKPVYLPPRPEPTPEEISQDQSSDGYRGSIFVDLDGSVGGRANHAIVLNNPFLLDTRCRVETTWNAAVCDYSYARLYIINESEGSIAPVSLTRLDGSHPVFRMWGAPRAGDNTHFGATLIKGRSYSLGVTGSMPARLKLRLNNSLPGDQITLSLPYSGTPHIYRDYRFDNRFRLPAASSRADFDNSTGDKYWIEGGRLWVKLVVQAGREWAALHICSNDLCR